MKHNRNMPRFHRGEISRNKLYFYLFLSVSIYFYLFPISALAAPSDNVTGFAWAGSNSITAPANSFGWISFNSANCDADSNTFLDVACGGNNTSTPIVNYGVAIDINSGYVSGYAWSSSLGWLSFNRADTGNPPSNDPGAGTGRIAQVNAGGGVTGWARFLSNGGIWDGWVRFDHGQANPVTISGTDFHGYAWAGGTLAGAGWISFNCAEQPTGCGSFPYKVTTTFTFDQSPSADTLNTDTTNRCGADGISSDTTFTWNFSDPDAGDTQSAYRVEVDNNSGFTNCNVSHDNCVWKTNPSPGDGWVTSSSSIWNTNITSVPSGTYFWRLKVRDNRAGESGWITTGPSFTLPWPNIAANFTWSPSNPLPDTPVVYTDATVCATSLCASWGWVFTNGTPGSSAVQNPPVITYSSSGTKTTTLTVTNGVGNSCPITKNVGVAGVPIWRRFLPF